jgi:predicted DNA-binding transcriptional regulator YafY
MSKAKRLFDILHYINSKTTSTAQELADEFTISVRPIHRYLLYLSDMGLPLYAQQGRNGGYTVLKNKILPPILFTEEVAASIFFAFQALSDYRSLPFDTEVSSVAQKLYHSLPHEAKGKVDKLRSHVAFWVPKRKIDTPLLKEILESFITNKSLHIQYESKSGVTDKHIRPIGIYAHDGLWYLPAFEYTKQRVLLFRIDRISSIQSTEQNHDNYMNLEEWFRSDSVKNTMRLRVLLTGEGVRQCISVPWLEDYIRIEEDGTGYIDTKIAESELSFTASLFYRLGADANIQEPQELIDQVRLKAYEILNLYPKDKNN